MTLSRVFLVLLVGLVSVSRAHAAQVAILNCSGADVEICAYDNTDILQASPASTATNRDTYYVEMKCNSGGGCYISVLKKGESCYNIKQSGEAETLYPLHEPRY